METIRCECGEMVNGTTCRHCGLVWRQEYEIPKDAPASHSPFLPTDGLSMDTRSLEPYIRRRSYEAASMIKAARDALNFPRQLAEGAMRRFNSFLSKRPAFRGERYSAIVAVCIFQEAHAWDFPVLERELSKHFGMTARAFRRKRRKMHLSFNSYSSKVLVNKYIAEHATPQDKVTEIVKWKKRAPRALDPRAVAAACIWMVERCDPFEIATYFETTRSEMRNARKKIMKGI